MGNPIVEQCQGCLLALNGNVCKPYSHPELQWTRLGGCAMRTHNKNAMSIENKKLNPLKASKRGVKQ